MSTGFHRFYKDKKCVKTVLFVFWKKLKKKTKWSRLLLELVSRLTSQTQSTHWPFLNNWRLSKIMVLNSDHWLRYSVDEHTYVMPGFTVSIRLSACPTCRHNLHGDIGHKQIEIEVHYYLRISLATSQVF